MWSSTRYIYHRFFFRSIFQFLAQSSSGWAALIDSLPSTLAKQLHRYHSAWLSDLTSEALSVLMKYPGTPFSAVKNFLQLFLTLYQSYQLIKEQGRPEFLITVQLGSSGLVSAGGKKGLWSVVAGEPVTQYYPQMAKLNQLYISNFIQTFVWCNLASSRQGYSTYRLILCPPVAGLLRHQLTRLWRDYPFEIASLLRLVQIRLPVDPICFPARRRLPIIGKLVTL